MELARTRAQELRRTPTDAEQRLWDLLRRRRFAGCKFRRQHPVGRYIVDFVCLERRLIVEVDGGQHDERRLYDAKRDAWLCTQQFRVLRFWNNDVDRNLEAVLTVIDEALHNPPPGRPAADHPPPNGEG